MENQINVETIYRKLKSMEKDMVTRGELNSILENGNYVVISVGINKKEFIEKKDKQEKQKTFEEAKEQIKSILVQQREQNAYKDMIEKLLKAEKVTIYEDIFKTVKSFKLEKEVIFTGYVNSNVLIRLYQNAFCFVLPSFYEGFGIPILEAMSYKCPVICSNTSSLPEIVGDAALFFNPNNYPELLKQFLTLETSSNLRTKLIDKGLKRTKNFSWQKCAKETLDILIEAAKES